LKTKIEEAVQERVSEFDKTEFEEYQQSIEQHPSRITFRQNTEEESKWCFYCVHARV